MQTMLVCTQDAFVRYYQPYWEVMGILMIQVVIAIDAHSKEH
jgi:hypothetical protein